MMNPRREADKIGVEEGRKARLKGRRREDISGSAAITGLSEGDLACRFLIDMVRGNAL